MGAVKNAITDYEPEDWPQALHEAAKDRLGARYLRRAHLAERKFRIAEDALAQIAEANVASWQQPAARIQDIAHDALGKIDVLVAENEKESA